MGDIPLGCPMELPWFRAPDYLGSEESTMAKTRPVYPPECLNQNRVSCTMRLPIS
jgi:hypothetical protein